MGLSDYYGIKYKLDKSEKFDEFMKALGVGMVTRKMGNAATPIIELTEENGEYTLKSSSTLKTTVIKFRLGVEFDEETADGRKVKSTITLDGDNKLVQVQRGEKECRIVREFSKEQCLATLTVEDVVCTRIYKAVE